jgi:hypothetical protein
MDDELYLAFGAKVTTTSNNNPTIAPPIAWRGLRYLSAKTVPGPPVRVHNVRFGSLADICSAKRHVRFNPESGHVQCNSECPLSANSGHCLTTLIAISEASDISELLGSNTGHYYQNTSARN